MPNIIFEKFSRGAGLVAKEVKNTYDEEIVICWCKQIFLVSTFLVNEKNNTFILQKVHKTECQKWQLCHVKKQNPVV